MLFPRVTYTRRSPVMHVRIRFSPLIPVAHVAVEMQATSRRLNRFLIFQRPFFGLACHTVHLALVCILCEAIVETAATQASSCPFTVSVI